MSRVQGTRADDDALRASAVERERVLRSAQLPPQSPAMTFTLAVIGIVIGATVSLVAAHFKMSVFMFVPHVEDAILSAAFSALIAATPSPFNANTAAGFLARLFFAVLGPALLVLGQLGFLVLVVEGLKHLNTGGHRC